MSAFENSTEPSTSTTPIIESCVKGLCKNQDFVYHGKSNIPEYGDYEWAVLLDGHGTNHFLNFICKQDWAAIMTAHDPWSHLEQILLAMEYQHYYEQSGSTLLMMRAFSDRIETISIGDSLILIHKNRQLVYKNSGHKLSNPDEIIRLNATRPSTWFTQTMRDPVSHIRSADCIQTKPSEYVFFGANTQLAMTQSIGHNNVTGYAPERHVEYYTPQDSIQCILASDGFSDMILLQDDLPLLPEYTPHEIAQVEMDQLHLLTMSAQQLLDKAEARWKQTWNYMWSSSDYTKITQNVFAAYDDISIVLWKK